MTKEYTAMIGGKPYIIHANVLSDEEYYAMKNAQNAIERTNIIETYRNACFSDKTLRRYTFAADDQTNATVSAKAQEYVKSFFDNFKKGRGLLFFGSVGVGKTFIAACIANALIDQCFSCYMTTFQRIYNKSLSTFEKQSVIDDLKKYDLLIIDDLAAESKTGYMSGIVFDVIDERIKSGKPLIVTTNLTWNELTKPVNITDSRIFSRLFEKCDFINVKGKDRRTMEFMNRVNQKG